MFLINLSNVIDIWKMAACPFLETRMFIFGTCNRGFRPKIAELFMRMSLPKQYIVYPGFEFYHSVQPKKYKTI